MAWLRSSKSVLDICDEAIAVHGKKRQKIIDDACDGDEGLRKSVVRLLEAIEDSGSFLQLDESGPKGD